MKFDKDSARLFALLKLLQVLLEKIKAAKRDVCVAAFCLEFLVLNQRLAKSRKVFEFSLEALEGVCVFELGFEVLDRGLFGSVLEDLLDDRMVG